MKADSIGVSFGYLAESEEGADGTRLLTSIDLFEISLTPSPMNPDARVLAWKSAGTPASTDSDWEFQAMRKRRDELWRQRDEEARRDREREQTIAEIKAKERRNRPVQVKTFEVG